MRIDFSPRFQMNPLMAGAAAAEAIGGLVNLGVGIAQRKEGKKLLKGLGEEQVPQEFIENQRLAKARAGEGLPSDQYNQAMRNIQRQQLMALRGGHDRRGGLGILPQIQQGTNDATLNLDVANANKKLENERYSMGINSQVGQFKNNIFRRKQDYAMQLKGTGGMNAVAGADKIGAGIGYGISGGLFGGGGGRTSTSTPNFTMSQDEFQRD